jgi:hypothetical protein
MLEKPRPEQKMPLNIMGLEENLNLLPREERIRPGDSVVILTGSVDKYLTLADMGIIISDKGENVVPEDFVSKSRLAGNKDNATVIVVKTAGM